MTVGTKSRFKWLKAIVMILLASLIYAVYFTDLGKPPVKNESPITFYNQTAIPTLFIEPSHAPTVALDWAYANQNLLKFVISVHQLETNQNLRDLICDPYITIAEPVQHRLSSSDLGWFFDDSGKSVRATYEYEVNAKGHNTLTVNLDLTLGPCADSSNFQESNVTPTPIPLIGNYHLSFRVPIRSSTPSTLKNTPAVAAWNGIPIYPGANQLREEEGFYIYTVQDTSENVEAFYNEKMASEGWKKFDRSKRTINNRRGIDIYFSKSEKIVTISILMPIGDELTTVSVNLVQ